MRLLDRRWCFTLFLLSGFSGLLYQIIWLRLAFAAFGIVTPVMSVLLSVFMLGLGLGSWLAGAIIGLWQFSNQRALRTYALAEAMIGVGGVVVPFLFTFGERLLLPVGETDSVTYLACSAGIMLLSLLPFCVCMGLTFPLMMQALRSGDESSESFSFLYLANVIGAMCGTFLTPVVLVELLGFRNTLWVGTCANWIVAGISIWLSAQQSTTVERRSNTLPAGRPTNAPVIKQALPTDSTNASVTSGLRLAVLFTTGMTSMAVEVVWTRAFTPVLMTQVYSFSGLLFTYLLATWCGSWWYRRQLAGHRAFSTPAVLSALALAAFGQLLLSDPRIVWPWDWLQIGWVLLSIVPYCGILGYLTPKLIDEYSAGNPRSAGRAYAVNVLGCILGPLAASYVLLPKLGVQWSGVLLAMPLFGLAAFAWRSLPALSRWQPRTTAVLGTAALCGALAGTIGTSYEDRYAARGAVIRRDHTATVIAYDDEQLGRKELLVNGKPITAITPTTKLMAHFPLCQLREPPRSALVICFGMGTTYRSLLSWDIPVTAVELVPSVRDSFDFYFHDAAEILKNPNGKIVIDDGRRFLRRTTERFDLITLDPPPPVEAAGSSLLYSTGFYDLVKPRLTDQGILHQWYPGGELQILHALLRSTQQSFPHVRMMRAFDGWGVHILASQQPIPRRSVDELIERLPQKAQTDMLEWSSGKRPADLLGPILANEVEVNGLLEIAPPAMITDDCPFNEYFVLRRIWQWWTGTYEIVL